MLINIDDLKSNTAAKKYLNFKQSIQNLSSLKKGFHK